MIELFTAATLAAALLTPQTPPVPETRADSARCDSILAASRVDSVAVALYVSVRQLDGPPLDVETARHIALSVGSAFVPPKPFRLGVFAGPSLSRSLRITRVDSLPVPRAPTVTGIYRFTAGDRGVASVRVARTSRVDGFDSAAVAAIRLASPGDSAFNSPVAGDSIRVDVQLTTDSVTGAHRLVSAYFPRMPIVDAALASSGALPEYPANVPADQSAGDVVLRFVVDRDGLPDFGTVELVRSNDFVFTRAALADLAKQRFRPASVHGCLVAQQIDFAVTFSPPP